jgi:hypothetical protein
MTPGSKTVSEKTRDIKAIYFMYSGIGSRQMKVLVTCVTGSSSGLHLPGGSLAPAKSATLPASHFNQVTSFLLKRLSLSSASRLILFNKRIFINTQIWCVLLSVTRI